MTSLVLQEEIDDALDELIGDFLTSSDSETKKRPHGGSQQGKTPNINRQRQDTFHRLCNDYLAPNPVYSSPHFCRRFRVSKSVFHEVCQTLQQRYANFQQLPNCTRVLGFRVEQKVTASLQLLANSGAAKSVDEYIRMSESTASQCLNIFCRSVVAAFGDTHLRCPTEENLQKILKRTRNLGFPEMIGSIDCCKWLWKNCPVAWRGQYQGKKRKACVTLEAIADDKLYIWHAFFGTPRSANDINVLETSPLVNKICDGTFPPTISDSINRNRHNVPYFLYDGVYPEYPLFVHTVQEPVTKKEKNLSRWQEERCKDIERAFGVLQSRWHMLKGPSRFWEVGTMHDVIYCCIILHNMMISEGLTAEEMIWADAQATEQEEVVHFGQPVSAEDDILYAVEGSILGLCQGEQFFRDVLKQRELQHDVEEHL